MPVFAEIIQDSAFPVNLGKHLGVSVPTLKFKGRVFVEYHHLAVPFHELKPIRDKGTSRRASLHDNLVIEGDNLAALKALLPFYHRKIKCIYIDPPYNTGKEEWAYNDNVDSPMMRDWLGKAVDREDLTRHDKWCCMMMPRLKLLRELLTDDGAIFISIDDNEVHHLRCLMDEVFGEENFVTNFIWHKKNVVQNDAKFASVNHDHVICYRRSEAFERFNLLPRSETTNQAYKNPDNDPRGPWQSVLLQAKSGKPQSRYKIKFDNGIRWEASKGTFPKFKKERLLQLYKEGRLYFGKTGKAIPRLKTYLSDVQQGQVTNSILPMKEVGSTQSATTGLKNLMGDAVFNSPKPVDLIRRLLVLVTGPGDIVLDSFAGSGTTAHAVLALNKEDGGNRRFVLVECEDYAGTLTAERIRRVVRGVRPTTERKTRDSLGGSFSYFRLGSPMRQESLLDGKELPDYEALAGYVFFTATGEEFLPAKINRRTSFIGRSSLYDVFLLYEPNVEKLKNLALTLDVASKLPRTKKDKLVFAPAKYLDQEFLHQYRITFQQLPFQIYETVSTLSGEGG